ncbi:hypothetical protein K502DRAFT_364929 [Neoconidiobolus thromboides FSU 785]|nr:hypothetical protein K502DRAFT_364929 [Neoconidiobolus thromboides FSU 785]
MEDNNNNTSITTIEDNINDNKINNEDNNSISNTENNNDNNTPNETNDISESKNRTKKNKGRVDPSRRAHLTPNVAGNYRGKKAADELLTDSQKKLHHIASEQKRRRNIKLGYDRLTDLVPNLEIKKKVAQPSETCVLQESVDYLRYLIEKKEELLGEIETLDQRSNESN